MHHYTTLLLLIPVQLNYKMVKYPKRVLLLNGIRTSLHQYSISKLIKYHCILYPGSILAFSWSTHPQCTILLCWLYKHSASSFTLSFFLHSYKSVSLRHNPLVLKLLLFAVTAIMTFSMESFLQSFLCIWLYYCSVCICDHITAPPWNREMMFHICRAGTRYTWCCWTTVLCCCDMHHCAPLLCNAKLLF